MIAGVMIAQAILLAVVGAAVAVLGVFRRPMNDWVLGAAALTVLTLVVQAVWSIVAALSGSGPTGDGLEYGVYLVTAMVIPAAAVFWALVDRQNRYAVLIVGLGILTCAVMVYRMHQIWFVQVA